MAKTITIVANNNMSFNLTIQDNEYATVRDMLNDPDLTGRFSLAAGKSLADLLYAKGGVELTARQARSVLDAAPADGDRLSVDADVLQQQAAQPARSAGTVEVVIPPSVCPNVVITDGVSTIQDVITSPAVKYHFGITSDAAILNMVCTVSTPYSDGSPGPALEVPKNQYNTTVLRNGSAVTLVQSKSDTQGA
jgi:hypothetical protein